jgi:hypothetical protein
MRQRQHPFAVCRTVTGITAPSCWEFGGNEIFSVPVPVARYTPASGRSNVARVDGDDSPAAPGARNSLTADAIDFACGWDRNA